MSFNDLFHIMLRAEAWHASMTSQSVPFRQASHLLKGDAEVH